MKTQALKRENEHCLDLEAELRLLSPYYANNAWKLRGIINNALKGIGGLTGADYDEFMSVAGEALTNALMIFDKTDSQPSENCSQEGCRPGAESFQR